MSFMKGICWIWGILLPLDKFKKFAHNPGQLSDESESSPDY